MNPLLRFASRKRVEDLPTFLMGRVMSEATITLDSREEAILLFGSRDLHLKEIRTALGVQSLVGRGDQIIIKGTDDQISLAQRVFGQLRQMLRDQGSLSDEDVKTVIEVVTRGGERLATQNDEAVGSRQPLPSAAHQTARPVTSGRCASMI